MDVLTKIIPSLTKEEKRNANLLLTRTNKHNERKDLLLFDAINKNENFLEKKEGVFIKQHYNDNKNAYYRLKNRLIEDVLLSLNMFHSANNNEYIVLSYIVTAGIFQNKDQKELAYYYLKKAEKKAAEVKLALLLDYIYSKIILFSQSNLNIDPQVYVKKRRANNIELQKLNELDEVLSVITYQIKTTQNYGKSNKVVPALLKKVNELTDAKSLKRNSNLRFKLYDTISRLLLQKQNYAELEVYVKKTFAEFKKENLFNAATHEYKLQMLTYLANALFKTNKLKESLAVAENIKDAISEHSNLLHDKYLFYYYNTLVINYSVINKNKAIEILEEAKENKVIQKLPFYNVFVYLNLSVLYFDTNNPKHALKSIIRMTLNDSFKELNEGLRLKIAIAEMLIRIELQEHEFVAKRLKQIVKEFAKALKQQVYLRERKMLEILELIDADNKKNAVELKTKIQGFLKHHASQEEQDSDIINLNKWLSSKTKRAT